MSEQATESPAMSEQATVDIKSTQRNEETGKNERVVIASFSFNDPAGFEDPAYGDLFAGEIAEWRIMHNAIVSGLKGVATAFLGTEEGTPEGLQAHMDAYVFPDTAPRRSGGGGRRKSVKLDADTMAQLEKMAKKGGQSVAELGVLLGIDISAAEAEA